MAKKRQKALASTNGAPVLGQVVRTARRASEALGSLSSQLANEINGLSTERGRKKLLARLEKEVRKVAQEPFRWMDVSTQSDLIAVRRRLRAIERRLDALDERDPITALPEPKPTQDSEAVA